MSAVPRFHNRTGSLVSLSNGNRTAQRNHPTQEFNNGVVLSSDPLRDDQLLEVKIDKKVLKIDYHKILVRFRWVEYRFQFGPRLRFPYFGGRLGY